METARKKKVILMGFKGCGKTTVGGPLAGALGVPFVDTDRLIEEIYEEKEGTVLTCREIFQKRGENFFRDLEREALENVCNLQGAVIALGGGAVEHPEVLARLKQDGLLVYLQVSSEELFRRIEGQGLPPFLSGEDPRRAMEELLERRSSLYEGWADATVSNGGGPVSEVVSRIAALVGGKNAGK